MLGTHGTQQREQAARSAFHSVSLPVILHSPKSPLQGHWWCLWPPTPCFPQNQNQITCHEACVTFLSTAALLHSEDEQLPYPGDGRVCAWAHHPPTARGQRWQGMHMPGATENNTGGQWEKYEIEKRMEEAKNWGKERETKKCTYSSWRGGTGSLKSPY